MTRYVPDRVLPAYAFLPGRAPHPRRDPAGHSYGVADEVVPYRDAAEWRDNAAYLWGGDLYNLGYPWEAHEAWEGVWLVARDAGDERQTAFVQGLIQCAAACVKARIDQPRGVAALAERGLGRLREVAAAEPRYMGLDLPAFIAAFEAFAASGGAGDPPRIELV